MGSGSEVLGSAVAAQGVLSQMDDVQDSCKVETRCSSSSKGRMGGPGGEGGDKTLTGSDDHDCPAELP